MFHPCFIEATVFPPGFCRQPLILGLLPLTLGYGRRRAGQMRHRLGRSTLAHLQRTSAIRMIYSSCIDVLIILQTSLPKTNSLRKSLEKLLYPPVTLKPASFWCRLGCGSSSWLTVHLSGFKWIGSSTCSALLFGCSPHGGKPKGWEILLRAKLTSSKETRLTGTVWNTCHTTLHGKCSEISVDF